MKKFKPMLMDNKQLNLNEIKYPMYSSNKLDGIRCIFKDGQMISRSFKQIPNKQLQKKFEELKELTKGNDLILDGELYCHGFSFQDVTRAVMTKDFDDEKTIKKLKKEFGNIKLAAIEMLKLIKGIKFYMFDIVNLSNLDEIFALRCANVSKLTSEHNVLIEQVMQSCVNNKAEVEAKFKLALDEGYEGLILKCPQGKYKCGRTTPKENLGYKVKPYITFDAQIIGFIQSTIVDPNAEKTKDKFGGSVTSNKKDDRIPIDRAASFVVRYKDKEVHVSIATTDKEKKYIWDNQNEFINRWIEYKGMQIGAKDVPRHPVFIRYRDEKS
ncbi:MAG: hypothetical protein KAX49_13105 [Halanaerobiales bacterium]|nr:hypothetical protein [Halanaerobiales bacterium]